MGDSGIERDKKPTLRKPLIPKRSDSHDSGNSNSFSVTDDLVPTGFDATEYEYLTKQESLDENDNIDDLNLSLGLSASGRTPSNASLVSIDFFCFWRLNVFKYTVRKNCSF